MHQRGRLLSWPSFAHRVSQLKRPGLLALLGLALLLGLCSAVACSQQHTQSLLAGLQPRRSQGVAAPERLTDGVRAPEGDPWDSEVSAKFTRTQSFVEYDLGASKPIRAAYAQGDNNDEYVLSGSEDGAHFEVFWIAPAQRDPGMRARTTDQLNARARYVRITAQGGDQRFALSEVQIFSEPPSSWSGSLRERSGVPAAETIRSRVMLLVLACAAWLWITRRRSSIAWSR